MLQIVISSHAMARPKRKPAITSDMQDIVDAFDKAGLYVPVPSAFRIGNKILCHPVVAEQLRKHSLPA